MKFSAYPEAGIINKRLALGSIRRETAAASECATNIRGTVTFCHAYDLSSPEVVHGF